METAPAFCVAINPSPRLLRATAASLRSERFEAFASFPAMAFVISAWSETWNGATVLLPGSVTPEPPGQRTFTSSLEGTGFHVWATAIRTSPTQVWSVALNVINFEDRFAARLARRAAAYGMDVIREPAGTWALFAWGFKSPELSGVTLREIEADLDLSDELEFQSSMETIDA